MIKAIIFDCFGVLAGSSHRSIYQQAGGDLEKDGAFVEDVLAQANQGLMSSRDMHQQVADRIGMSFDVWYKTVQKGELPNEQLLEYIATLRPQYKTAILSNANVGTIQRKFSPEQLKLFDAIVVSAEVGMMKPNAEIYQYAADQLGQLPEECVFTDDSEGYCEGAVAAGLKAIHYKDFQQFKTELEQILHHT